MNSFVSTQAAVDTIYQTEYEHFGRSASNHIHQIHVYVKVHFNANNREQRAAVYLAEFSWLNFDEANNFINDFKKKGNTTTILYDPADISYVVKSKSEIPGFFTSSSIIILNLIVLIVLFALFFMGIAGVYSFFKPGKYRAPNQPISEKRKAYLKNKYYPKTEETKTVITERILATNLTGNLLDDYYSGALEYNALQCWHGYYCEVYLFSSGVIVAFQEDKGYYVREYSLPDIINKKFRTPLMDSFFGDDEKELEQRFFDAVAGVYHNQG